MKKLTTVLLLAGAAACVFGRFSTPVETKETMDLSHSHPRPHKPPSQLRLKSKEAQSFATKNGFNTDFCFLIDMSLPSGRKRFLVYDLNKDSLLLSGLVAHGCCNQNFLQGRKYGNTPGCGCTSLGKYKVGYPYVGRFGKAFKLYGLDTSNSKAFERAVVLHSYPDVPENEVNEEICQSYGCPMVAPPFLKRLETMITSSKKPVLLWIFD